MEVFGLVAAEEVSAGELVEVGELVVEVLAEEVLVRVAYCRKQVYSVLTKRRDS